MIFLKRRALMTRASFNYKTVSGIGSVVLENCVETKFKRLVLSGNSVQGENPSIESPKEIINTGRKSRNLFDVNNRDETTCVTTIPNQAFAYDPLHALSNMISVKQGQSIVKGNSGSKMCIFLDANKEPILSTKASVEDGKAIKVPSGAYYFCFNILKTNLSNNIMCNIGNVLLPYELYTDKYLVNIEVTGKNLFDKNKLIKGFINLDTGKWETQQQANFPKSLVLNVPIKLKKGHMIVTSGIVDIRTYLRYRAFKQNGEYLYNEIVSNRYVATEDVFVYVMFHNGILPSIYDVLQIEIASEPTEYEPYLEPQTLQLKLDEPLRGIGNYKDVIAKDGIVRKVKEVVLNGSEQWLDMSNENLKKVNRFGFVTNEIFYNTMPKAKLSLCDKFPLGDINADEVGHVLYSNRVCFMVDKDTFPNLQTWREWLSKNPATVQYVLRTSLFEQFPQETQLALDSIHANDETTIISVDSGEVKTGIEVEYAVKS